MGSFKLEFDADGYPTEASLSSFPDQDDDWRAWAACLAALPEMMEPCYYAVVSSKWVSDDHPSDPDMLEVEFHTQGWSGAESVIEKVLDAFVVNAMFYERWERGGHHYFRIPAHLLEVTRFARTPDT